MYWDVDNRVSTKTHFKAHNKFPYVHLSSDHPTHMWRALVKRNCSESSEFAPTELKHSAMLASCWIVLTCTDTIVEYWKLHTTKSSVSLLVTFSHALSMELTDTFSPRHITVVWPFFSVICGEFGAKRINPALLLWVAWKRRRNLADMLQRRRL